MPLLGSTVADFVGHDVGAGVGLADGFEVFVGLQAGVVVADAHLEIGFVVNKVGLGVGEQAVERVAGVFSLGFGVHARIGGDLDAVSVDFAQLPPVVDVIFLNFDNPRVYVIVDVALSQCNAANGQE